MENQVYVFGASLEQEKDLFPNQFPQFLKDFLNDFVQSNFFKGVYEEQQTDEEKKYMKENNKFYLACDWEFEDENIDIILKNNSKIFGDCSFGKLGFYQYDTVCSIIINFEEKTARTERGYCFGSYGTGRRITRRTSPKYMQPLLQRLFEQYDGWAQKEKEKTK